ncbi:uncharacterized protein [Diadema setosum]|uniref:uncharacterized protein isoform X1 n=1 Tax=Diadema setosum TaxID=31175 RepID=UPI003B3AB3BB
MASDTEDLELESLRSAVLASLKSKPSGAGDKADSTASPKVEDEEEEEEDLLALRLAALKSKREGGSTNVSHVSTPVSGSPAHQPNPQVQLLPQPKPPPPQPLPRNRVETCGNLITIPLQDFSQPPKPPVKTTTRLGTGNNSDTGDVAKEERSTKFSRFESSDSESDGDLDDFLPESVKSNSRHNSDDSEASDSERSASANSDSADENDDSSVSEAESEKQSSASEESEGGDDDKSAKSLAENHGDVPSERRDNVKQSSGEENRKISERTDKAGDANESHRQRTSDSRRHDRKQRSEASHHRSDDSYHGDRRRERNMHGMRDRRDDGYRRDRVRERQRHDLRRELETGRKERLPSPEYRLKDKSDRRKRDEREKPSVDSKTFEARQRKFASGASVNIKDRTLTLKASQDIKDKTLTLKDVKRSEVDNGSRSKDHAVSDTKGDSEANGEIEKGAPAPESESDISLSSEETEEEADKSDQVEEDEKVETSHAMESDSDSESETSRFKHNSTSDTKPAISLPESRLITSMKFPKEGYSDGPPRRRPNGGDRTRELRVPSNRDSHRGRDDRGLERERPRRAHLPRHLDRQERSSSRDRPRLSEREPRRHPRDVAANDRPERKPGTNVDNPAVERKLPSKHDFVSESSESESEGVNQGLRSIVQTDKHKEQRDRKCSRDKRNRSQKEQTVDSDRRDRDQKREKKSKHRRDLKERIGRKRDEEDRRVSDDDTEETVPEVRRVTLAEDDAQQKKISVMDRLGATTSPERPRGSVKSRLGPVKVDASKPSIELDAIDPVDDDFPRHDQLGPHGDSLKRRHIEIHDGGDERTRKRTRLKHGDGRERDAGEMEKEARGEIFTAAEPPVKRKQLSKSLLSRLSDRPSTPVELETLAGRLSPSLEEEQERRRVKSRDADRPSSRDKERERKTRTRDVWSSSKRKTVALERSERSPEPEHRGSRDKALDEKIKKIMKQNAAILQRQQEIEEEKKLFCGGR